MDNISKEELLRRRRIGHRLCELRGDELQSSVAKKLGVSEAAISMYESGKRWPRDTIKIKIAKLYGESIESLFYSE